MASRYFPRSSLPRDRGRNLGVSSAGVEPGILIWRMSQNGSGIDEVGQWEAVASSPVWKTLLPWIGAAAIVGFLLWQVPVERVWDAALGADLAWGGPVLVAGVVFWFLLDSWAYAYLVSQFNVPFSWAEGRALRGVTYLVAAVNWNAGTASIILYLRRFNGVPVLEAASSVFFYTTMDLLVLFALAFAGASFVGPSSEVENIRNVSGAALITAIAALWVLMASRPRWSWLQRARRGSILRAFRLARSIDVFVLLAVRIVYFAGFLAIFYFGGRAFGIEVPFGLVLASVPLVLMAGALPLTPGGVGTQAAAMLFFWSGAGDEAAILAFGLVFPVGIMLVRVFVALPYLSQLRKLRSGS